MFTCPKGCCSIYSEPYVNTKKSPTRAKSNKKSGMFIIYTKSTIPFGCTNDDFVLLVQSKGNLWGIPKGTFDKVDDNSPIKCAIREVYEETGFKINANELTRHYVIKNECNIYYVKMKSTPTPPISKKLPSNDVNGIGWFKLSCLRSLIKSKHIKLNYITNQCFRRYIQLNIY